MVSVHSEKLQRWLRRWYGETALAFQITRLIERDGDLCGICGFFLGEAPLDDGTMGAWADARPVVDDVPSASDKPRRLVHAWCQGIRNDPGDRAVTSADTLHAIADELRRAQTHLAEFRAIAKRGRQK